MAKLADGRNEEKTWECKRLQELLSVPSSSLHTSFNTHSGSLAPENHVGSVSDVHVPFVHPCAV